jgi:hypothetical protein
MSKKDKREQRIRSNISSVSLEDFEALINSYGYIKEGGKHPQAVISDTSRNLTYKRENPMKAAYVKQLLLLIDNRAE